MPDDAKRKAASKAVKAAQRQFERDSKVAREARRKAFAQAQREGLLVFPRFRRHLSAWVERLRQGEVDATHQAAIPTGVPA
jgi:hypothetical protein